MSRGHEVPSGDSDFTMEWNQRPHGLITDVRVTKGRALYRLSWWRRLITPWRVWRFRNPTVQFPDSEARVKP
jgi:hypothetical protein